MKESSLKKQSLYLFLPLLLLTGLEAAAEEAPTVEKEEGLSDWHGGYEGRVRFRHSILADFPTDNAGDITHGQEMWGTVLTRWSPHLAYKDWVSTNLTLDLWNGIAYGDESFVAEEALVNPWTQAESLGLNDILREAYIDLNVGIGRLRVGRMASNWGLGLVANNGDQEPDAFADATHGDISNRVLFITQPLAFIDGVVGDSTFLLLAADWVERDELSSRAEGDETLQSVGALIWRRAAYEVGTYAAYRHLESAEGFLTTAWANDIYLRWTRAFEAGSLSVETEWVMLQGSTEEVRFLGAPFPVDIQQFGGAGRVKWSPKSTGILGVLDMGWAPGDNAPKDGSSRGIRFDPGFKVGMILFEEVLGRLTAQSQSNASDPALMATPSQGVDRIPSNGSVHNAVYVAPQIGYRSWGERIDARLGLLAAFSSGDVMDPYSSGLNGGYSQSFFEKNDSSGYLGTELLTGLTFTESVFSDALTFRLGAEYGVFFPGEALQDSDGNSPLGTPSKIRILTDLSW